MQHFIVSSTFHLKSLDWLTSSPGNITKLVHSQLFVVSCEEVATGWPLLHMKQETTKSWEWPGGICLVVLLHKKFLTQQLLFKLDNFGARDTTHNIVSKLCTGHTCTATCTTTNKYYNNNTTTIIIIIMSIKITISIHNRR